MNELTTKNLLEFIKQKKHYYLALHLHQKINDDNKKPLYFYECISLLMDSIEMEFNVNEKNKQ
jgi:hypothetical protein